MLDSRAGHVKQTLFHMHHEVLLCKHVRRQCPVACTDLTYNARVFPITLKYIYKILILSNLNRTVSLNKYGAQQIKSNSIG